MVEIDPNLLLSLDDNTYDPRQYKGSVKAKKMADLQAERDMENVVGLVNRQTNVVNDVSALAPINSYWEEGETLRDLQNGQGDYIANNQGSMFKFANTIGQGVGTFTTAVMSSLGVLASIPYAALNEAVTEGDQNTMDDILNNPVMRGISDLDKAIKTDLFPTYYTKEQQESLISAATGTDLINGIGFLLSAIVPNALIVKAFGSLSKVVSLSKAGKLTTALEEAVAGNILKVEEAAKIGSLAQTINKTGEVAGALVGRLGESAMEANQTYDELIANGYSEEEAKTQRNNVLTGNMLLGISDFNQATRWFNRGKNGISKDIITSGGKYAVKTLNWKEKAGEFIKESLQEAGEEGFQYVLQQGANKAAESGRGFIESSLGSAEKAFTTIEGQKSMLLGAILGGGASTAFKAMNAKEKNAHLNQLVTELNNNPVLKNKYIQNADGQMVLNPEVLATNAQFAAFDNFRKQARDANDEDAVELIDNLQFASIVNARKKADLLEEFTDELEGLGKATPAEIKAMFGDLPIDWRTGEEMTPAKVAQKYISEAKRISKMIDGIDNVPQFKNLPLEVKNLISKALITQDSIKKSYEYLQSEINYLSASSNPFDIAILKDEMQKAEILEKSYADANLFLESLVNKPSIVEERINAKIAATEEAEEKAISAQENNDTYIQNIASKIEAAISKTEDQSTPSDYELLDLISGETFNITNDSVTGTKFFDIDGNDVTDNFLTNHPKVKYRKIGSANIDTLKTTDVDLDEQEPSVEIQKEGFKKTNVFTTAGRNSVEKGKFNDVGDRRDNTITANRKLYYKTLDKLANSNATLSLKLETVLEFEGTIYDTPVIKAILYLNGKQVEENGIVAYTTIHEATAGRFALKNPEDLNKLNAFRQEVIARNAKGIPTFVSATSVSTGFLNIAKPGIEFNLNTLRTVSAVGEIKIAVSMLDDNLNAVIVHNGQEVNVENSGRPYLAVQTGTENNKPVFVYQQLFTRKLNGEEIVNIMLPLIERYLNGEKTVTISNKTVSILSYDKDDLSVLDMFVFFGTSANSKKTSIFFNKDPNNITLFFGEDGQGSKLAMNKTSFETLKPQLIKFLESKTKTVSNKHLQSGGKERLIPYFGKNQKSMIKVSSYIQMITEGILTVAPGAVTHNIVNSPEGIFLNRYVNYDPRFKEVPDTKVKVQTVATIRKVEIPVVKEAAPKTKEVNAFETLFMSEGDVALLAESNSIVPVPENLRHIRKAGYGMNKEQFIKMVTEKYPAEAFEVLGMIGVNNSFESPVVVEEVVAVPASEAKKADIEKRRQEDLFGNLTELEFETVDAKGRTRKTIVKTKTEADGFKYSFETTVDGGSSSTSHPKTTKQEFMGSSIYKNLDQNSKEFIDELPEDSIITLESIAISTDKKSAAGLGNGNITIGYISKEDGISLHDTVLKYQPNKINAKYDAELDALNKSQTEITNEPDIVIFEAKVDKPKNIDPLVNDIIKSLNEGKQITMADFPPDGGDTLKQVINLLNIKLDTKITENGKPILLFHGSPNIFNSFSKEFLGSYTNSPSAKQAFFAAEDLETAITYGEYDKIAENQLGMLEGDNFEPDADFEEYKYINSLPENNPERILYESKQNNIRTEVTKAKDKYFTWEWTDNQRDERVTFNNKTNIYPLFFLGKNPLIIDVVGNRKNIQSFNDQLIKAKNEGYDSVIFKNVSDAIGGKGKLTNIYTVFDSNQIVNVIDVINNQYASKPKNRFNTPLFKKPTDSKDFPILPRKASTKLPYKKGDINAAVKWIQAKLGVTPEVAHGLIRVAGHTDTLFGYFQKNAIVLSDILEEGTEYHEAFHLVSQMFFSYGQRKALYNEARRIAGDLNDFEAEEYIAEKFREYVMSDGKMKFPATQKSFFAKLWNFIKSLMGISTPSLNEVFANINAGYYNKTKYINVLGNLNNGLQVFGSTALPPSEELKINQALLSYYRQFLNDKLEFNTFAEYATARFESFNSAFNIEPALFLNNFKKIIAVDFGIDLDATSEEDSSEANSRNRGNEYAESSKVSGFAGISDKVNFVLNTVGDASISDSEIDERDYQDVPLIPATEVKAYLANLLHDTFTLQEMLTKLENVEEPTEESTPFQIRNYGMARQIIDSIGPMSNDAETVFYQTEFFDALSLVYQSMLTQIYYTNGTVNTIDSMQESVKRKIKESWTSNFLSSPYVDTIEGQRFIIDAEALYGMTAENFIKATGIVLHSKIDNKAIKIIDNFKNASKDLPTKTILINGESKNVKSPYIFNKLEEYIDENSSKDNRVRIAKYKKALIALLDLEVDNYNAVIENQSRNTENEQVYAFAKPSFLFQRFAAIKKGLSKYGTVKNSKLWDAIVDNKVTITLVDGAKVNDSGEEGRHISTLTEEELLLNRINGLYGTAFPTINFLQMADKKSVYGLVINDKNLICNGSEVSISDNRVLIPTTFLDRLWDMYENYLNFDTLELNKKYVTTGSAAKLFEDLADGKLLDRTTFNDAIQKEIFRALLDARKIATNFTTPGFNAIKNLLGEKVEKTTLDHVLAGLITTELVTNLEQMNIFFGNPSFYKALFKRTPSIRANGRIPSIDNNVNEYILSTREKYYGQYAGNLPSDPTKYQSSIFADVEVSSKYAQEYAKELGSDEYSKVNATDGQGLMTFQFYREYAIRTGQWSDKLEKQFEAEMNNAPIEGATWLPLKLVHFGPDTNVVEEYVPVFYKFAVYPLIPSMIKGRKLEETNTRMLEQGSSIGLFDSGNKVGNLVSAKTQSVYEQNVGNNHVLNIQDLKIQVDISAKKEKWDVLFGTQIRKLIMQNIADAGIDFTNEEDYKKYVDIINDLVKKETETLAKSLDIDYEDFINGNITPVAWGKLIELFKESAVSRGESDNVITSLDFLNTNTLTIDLLPTRNKIQNLMNALINNRILKQKMFGRSYVQVSSVGFEYATEASLKTALNNGDILEDSEFYRSHFVNDVFDNSKARLGFIHRKEDKIIDAEILLPYHFKTKKFKISDISPELLQSLGYRIPTQGLNSMSNFKIVGFLPKSADQIVAVPYEITMQAGSDFDVDKLNLFLTNYSVSNQKPIILLSAEKRYALKLKLAQNLVDKADNALITVWNDMFASSEGLDKAGNIFKEAFKAAEITVDEEERLTDDEIKEVLFEIGINKSLTDIRQALQKIIDNPDTYINAYKKQEIQNSLLALMMDRLRDPKRFLDYITPNSAQNLKSQAFEINNAQQSRYKTTVDFKGMKQFWTGTGIKIGRIFWSAKDGVGQGASQGTFTALTQVSPIYQSLYSDRVFADNHKNEKGEIVFGKILNVVGKSIIDFIANQHLSANVDAANDPFIFQLNANGMTNDTHYYLLTQGIDDVWVNRFMTQPIIMEYVKRMSENQGLISKLKRISTKKLITVDMITEDIRKEYGGENIPSEYLTARSENGRKIPFAANRPPYTTEQLLNFIKKPGAEQLNILDDFLFYNKWATERRTAISSVKFDTQGAGKNLPEAKIFQYKRQLLRKNIYDGVQRLISNTVLKAFEDNVLNPVVKIYEPVTTVHQSVSLSAALDRIMDILQSNNKLKLETLYKVYGMLTNVVMQNNLPNAKQWFDSNIYSANSVARKIATLIRNGELKDNYLFTNIIQIDFGKKDGDADIIKLDNSVRITPELEKVINQGFRDFKLKFPFVYKDLIILSLFQTGVIESTVSYYKYIPVEDFVEISKDLVKPSNVTEQDATRLIMQNLYMLRGLAPFISRNKIVGVADGLPDTFKTKREESDVEYYTKQDNRLGIGLYQLRDKDSTTATYMRIPITGNYKLYNGIVNDQSPVESELENPIEETWEDAVEYFEPVALNYLLDKQSIIVEEFKGFWKREDVAKQTNKVFLFGDNTDDRINTKYIPSSTQAVIRGLPNAIGIDTKNDRDTRPYSYFKDSDFKQFKQQVDEAIDQAKNSGKTIVIPVDGIGTGKAMLKEKAPKLFDYLQQELNKLKTTALGLPANTQEIVQEKSNVTIYSQLGNKTVSENIIIKSVYQQEGVAYAKSIDGIFSMRVNNSEKHFGNPFSPVSAEIEKGLIATKSTKEAVEKYIDWILNNKYDFDNIENVFLLAMPAESKLDREEKGRFSITDKTVLVKKKDIKTALIHELVHEYINILPESKRLKLYENIHVFSEKVEKDEYFKKAKGLYSNLQDLQKFYGKDEKSPQYAEEIINIFLGNRAEYSTIHDLINSKYKEEFYSIIKDIDLKRIQNKADKIIKKDKVHTELKGYHDKYTVPYLIEPQRRDWIREQLKSGALKGKPIVYYKELGEPSHATALDYLINKYNWNTQEIVQNQSVTFEEEQTSGYRNRTIKNASADATIAIAVDFTTAGERLTKNSVLEQNKKYLPVSTDIFASSQDVENMAGMIVSELRKLNKKEITLNIAGNGIYTLKDTFPGGQNSVDSFTLELLKAVKKRLDENNIKIILLRTGGQTGFDEAGTKAGIKLGLSTLTLAPKGWTFRNATGQDISNEQQFKARFGMSSKPSQTTLFDTTWNNLSDDNQSSISKAGITKEEFDDMSENNKLKAIECYGTKK